MTATVELDPATAELSDPVEAAEGASDESTPLFNGVLRGLRLVDFWVLGALFLWPCAYLPVFSSQAWTPRVMGLMVAVPVGGLAIFWLLRRRDRAAVLAAAALGWAMIGAAFSGNAILSLKGVVSTNSSVLIFAGSIGFWASARFMSTRGRQLSAPVFIVACGANLLVGLAQVVFRIDSSSVSLVGERAVGLTGNSMMFGTFMAAGGALSIRSAASGAARANTWLVVAFALSLGTAISGSRVAMVAVVLAGALGVLSMPRTRAALALTASMAGVLAGSILSRIMGGQGDALSRLSRSGTGGRTTVWRTATEAVLERPLTGWGPGRFRYALQGRYSIDELAAMPHLPRFWDAHNFVVELAVVVGIPGLILLCGFVWSASRGATPALIAAVGAIIISWLLQPISYQTLPIAMILLGAAALPIADTDTAGSSSSGARFRSLLPAALAVGLVPALVLGVADVRLLNAMRAVDAEAAESAAALFFHDPMAMDTAATTGWIEAESDPVARRVLFDSLERSLEFEPENPFWWNQLALAQAGISEDLPAAARSAERAIDLAPFDERAWITVWAVAVELDDVERRVEAAEVLCRLRFEPACQDSENGSEGTVTVR